LFCFSAVFYTGTKNLKAALSNMGDRPSKTQKRICHYKWEFLRRNPEYREDYKAFSELCGRNNWDPKSGSARYETFEKNPDRQIRRKHGIAFLEDPDRDIPMDNVEENPFWPLIEDRGLKRPTWPSILKPHYPKGEPVIKIFINQFKGKIAAPLALVIDLTYPKSEIMARVKNLIDEAIEERKIRGLLIHKGRKHFDLYDQYLKIWDLREKGLTYKEIAAKVYPDEPLDYEIEANYDEFDTEKHEKRVEELIAQGADERSAYAKADREFGVGGSPVIQRVSDQYNEADRLINGGYQEIR